MKRKIPLTLTILLPTMAGVLLVQGLGSLGGYFAAKNADYQDSCTIDEEYLERTAVQLSFFPKTKELVDSFKAIYDANPRETPLENDQEAREYSNLFASVLEGETWQSFTTDHFTFDRTASIRDYAEVGFFDETRSRFVVIVSLGDSSIRNPMYPGTYYEVNAADFANPPGQFLGARYHENRRYNRDYFVSGKVVGRNGATGMWILSHTYYEDVFLETKQFMQTFSYVSASTFVAMTVLAFFAIRFGLIGPIRRTSKRSDAYVASLRDGSPEEVFALDHKKTTNELRTLNDSLFYMQEAIKDYGATIAENAAKEEKRSAELALAEKIQSSMVPSLPLLVKQATIYGTMAPAKEVGGDFYDYFEIDDTHVGFVLADVSGKGVPAALFMAKAASISRLLLPNLEIEKINDTLSTDNRENLFVTGFYGVFDRKSGVLQYVNCGHEPVYIRHNGVYQPLEEEANLPLGLMDGFAYTKQSVQLDKGDALFLYTDGLSEAMNENEELFGKQRILETLNAHPYLDGKELIVAMEEAMADFVGKASQSDDACFLTFAYASGFEKDFTPDHDGLASLAPFIEISLKGLPLSLVNTFQVAVDEFASNIVLYSKASHAHISFSSFDEQIVCTLRDDGLPFNPLEDKPPHDEDMPGGLGIELAKAMVSDLTYDRAKGMNLLSFSLKQKEEK